MCVSDSLPINAVGFAAQTFVMNQSVGVSLASLIHFSSVGRVGCWLSVLLLVSPAVSEKNNKTKHTFVSIACLINLRTHDAPALVLSQTGSCKTNNHDSVLVLQFTHRRIELSQHIN